MLRTKLIESKLSARQKDYSVEIVLEDERTVVRKNLIIGSVRVPIDETYALDLKTAIMVLSHFTIEILGYSLN